MKKPLICGNWKMYKGIKESRELAILIKEGCREKNVEIVLFPSFVALLEVASIIKGSEIKIGAQNMHYEDWGAFTGEVSALMIKEAGCSYVIIGHSERRRAGEDDAQLKKKVETAIKHGIFPILCVGEKLEEREAGKEKEVVETQLCIIKEIGEEALKNVTVAYEPVWAIGTGKTATVQEAESMHLFIKERLKEWFPNSAEDVRIIYGGSVFPENIASLIASPFIDGALVGGASVKGDAFLKIVEEAERAWKYKKL